MVRLIALDVVVARQISVPASGIFGRAVERTTVELRLVPGKASPRHGHRDGTPFVTQGHVDGLSKIDRRLLSIIFDHIADSDVVTASTIDAFTLAYPSSYASSIGEWRELVVSEARHRRLVGEGSSREARAEIRLLRRAVSSRLRRARQVHDPGVLVSPTGDRLLELAIVFGLGRGLASLCDEVARSVPQVWFSTSRIRGWRTPLGLFVASMKPAFVTITNGRTAFLGAGGSGGSGGSGGGGGTGGGGGGTGGGGGGFGGGGASGGW